MEFRMLGELEVRDGETDVPIRGAKQRALLLLLLVRAGETVQAERLADELWGDAPPAGGANALQALVSKLRRGLGGGGALLVTGSGGYRLDVSDDDIDAIRFEQGARRGRVALDDGDAATAADELRAALSLWRGPALDGSDDEGILRREAQRLEELRWMVLEDRVDADLQCGRHGELVAELEDLVGRAPLRERLHGFLMLALYRAGRQAEALRAFQMARDVLGEELGLDPSPELRALETAILNQDPGLEVRPDAARAAPRRRSNLTPALSSFVGRAGDLAEVGELVASRRLLTIVGPGGAGKTRVALEVGLGRQDQGDVFLLELAALGDPDAVVDSLVSALGVPHDATLPVSVLDRVVAHIGDRETLLLLDNCEHLVGEAARVAEHLLGRCPGLRILATSREALGVSGEAIWPIPPMSDVDATALFAARAAASGVTTSGHDASIHELCERLDGLPLAIELAAARARVIPVPQLTERLDDRFRLLKGGARTALPRQQTLRAVVEWSYDLLFDDERQVFDRLSVFSGGCTLEAAEAVCATDDIDALDVADILARLVDKSLVVAGGRGDAGRFDLLQTLSLFGRERLAARADGPEAWARHADFFLQLGRRGADAVRGHEQVAWVTALRRDLDNVRSALGWLIDQRDAEGALALVGGIAWTFWLSGSGAEGVRLFDAAMAAEGDTTTATRAYASMWAGAVMSNAGTGLDRAVQLCEESLQLWQATDDRVGLGEACALTGGVLLMAGRRDRAIEVFDLCVEIFAGQPSPWHRALAASSAGRAATLRGRLDEAEPFQREAVAQFEVAGVVWAQASIHSDLAMLAEMRGDLEASFDFTTRALHAARLLDLGLAESQLLPRLANLELVRGDRAAADALLEEGIARAEEVGARLSLAFALNSRAMARREVGQLDDARGDAHTALDIWRTAEAPAHQALALATLGFIAERAGEMEEAQRLHEEVVALGRSSDVRAISLGLYGLAGTALASGEPERAALLIGRAWQIRIGGGGVLPLPWFVIERMTDETREALGEAAFDAARAAGATASTDALVPVR